MNELKEELVPIGASPLETLSQSIVGNLSLQKESMNSLLYSIQKVKKSLKDDFIYRERDLKNLSYIARDIKDNFQFTLMIADDVNIIDELIHQINLLALNITIESSKLGETGDIFGELSKDIREKSDKIDSVIERIFTKEVKNKSFREHNRYIQNSVLHHINERIESLGSFIGGGDDLIREISSTQELLEDLIHSVDLTFPLSSTLTDLIKNLKQNNNFINIEQIETITKTEEFKPQELYDQNNINKTDYKIYFDGVNLDTKKVAFEITDKQYINIYNNVQLDNIGYNNQNKAGVKRLTRRF
jgi:methyl-accepting chemotaxis protein